MFELPDRCVEKICLKLPYDAYVNLAMTSKQNMVYLAHSKLTCYRKLGRSITTMTIDLKNVQNGKHLRFLLCKISALSLKDKNIAIILRFRPSFFDVLKQHMIMLNHYKKRKSSF